MELTSETAAHFIGLENPHGGSEAGEAPRREILQLGHQDELRGPSMKVAARRDFDIQTHLSDAAGLCAYQRRRLCGPGSRRVPTQVQELERARRVREPVKGLSAPA